MNLIKVMNFSGAGETINFSFTRRRLERQEPAAVQSAFLGHGDAFGFTRRIEGVLADAVGGGFLTPLAGRFTQERNW
jgi:hypothetical protein